MNSNDLAVTLPLSTPYGSRLHPCCLPVPVISDGPNTMFPPKRKSCAQLAILAVIAIYLLSSIGFAVHTVAHHHPSLHAHHAHDLQIDNDHGDEERCSLCAAMRGFKTRAIEELPSFSFAQSRSETFFAATASKNAQELFHLSPNNSPPA